MSDSPDEDSSDEHGHSAYSRWRDESTAERDSDSPSDERERHREHRAPNDAKAPRRVAIRKIHAEVGDDDSRVGGSRDFGAGGSSGRRSSDKFGRRDEIPDEPQVPPVVKMPGRPKGEGRRRNSESEPITGETDVPRTSPPEQTVRTEEPPAPTPPPPAVPPSDQGSHEATDFDKPPAPKGRDVGTLPVVSVGPAPLICVTGNNARIPMLPVDGVCDFAVFSDVIFGDNEWVSASSRGKLDTFLHDAEKSAATTFLLSFPAKMRRELVPFLSSSAAMELIRSYASRGIRGYGFARAEVPAEQLHNLSADYTTVLKLLRSSQKAAVPSSGLSFMGVMLRAIKNAKGAALPFPTDIASNVDLFIAVSHTPVLPANGCRVEPTSSWTHEHINDYSLPSLSGTLEMLRDGRNVSATLAMSLTLGVLDYGVSPSGLAGIDGTWNVACTHSQLEPFEQTCRNPLTRGTVGAEDLLVYDFSKKTRSWRSFEISDSISAKVRKCFQMMRSAGFDRFGWAMYDVDLEDHSTACVPKGRSEASTNRLAQAKQLLKSLAASKAPAG
ncbi:uncharacterized protein LOC144124587 isoform X2 [Amblyomma americanum]